MDPTWGGFPRDASVDQPGETGEDDDMPPAKVPRVHEAGSAGADQESPFAFHIDCAQNCTSLLTIHWPGQPTRQTRPKRPDRKHSNVIQSHTSQQGQPTRPTRPGRPNRSLNQPDLTRRASQGNQPDQLDQQLQPLSVRRTRRASHTGILA